MEQTTTSLKIPGELPGVKMDIWNSIEILTTEISARYAPIPIIQFYETILILACFYNYN